VHLNADVIFGDSGQLSCAEALSRAEMKAGFDRRENLLLAEQKREIEDLKKRMTRLEDAFAG
jgi:hypothetical protein